MTAAVKVQLIATSAAPDAIELIALRDLRRAPWNARKSFDAKSLAELATSIKQVGIQSPLIVRRFKPDWGIEHGLQMVWYLVSLKSPMRNKMQTFSHYTEPENKAAAQAEADRLNGPGSYEIVAGHRRYQAALDLKLGEVPCIVRELTDDEAREIGLVDNVQREDVPALEEADGYAELQQRLGSASAIAARVGKDVSYVARRLQLVSLGELPRKALAERLITVDHALLLARLGDDEQNVNLKWTLNPNAGIKESVESVIAYRIKERDREGSKWRGYWEPQSVLSLKNHIEEHVGRKLSKAPWDLADAKLVPDAGPCSGCPSNTKDNTALFGDLAIDEATCENGGCFEAKRAAFVQIQMSNAAGDKVALRVSWKLSETKPRWAKDGSGPNEFQVFRYGQWLDVKKGSCEHVRNGVTVDWDEPKFGTDRGQTRKPGQILLVCIADNCKAHPKSWEKKAKQVASGDKRDPEAEKAAREKRAADARVETKLRVAVASKAIENIKGIPAEAIRAIAVEAIPNWQIQPLIAVMPHFQKALKTSPVNSADFAQALALVSIEELSCAEHRDADGGRAEFLASMKRIGYTGELPGEWKPKAAAKKAAKTPAKTPAKKAAKKAVKKAAKKGGAR